MLFALASSAVGLNPVLRKALDCLVARQPGHILGVDAVDEVVAADEIAGRLPAKVRAVRAFNPPAERLDAPCHRTFAG